MRNLPARTIAGKVGARDGVVPGCAATVRPA